MTSGQHTDPLGYLAAPGDAPGRPVLIIHSWWGLTPSFSEYADRLAGHGLLVGCADLYGGEIARTEEDVERLRGARRSQPMYKTLAGAVEHLQQRCGDPEARVALVGFSMGGHWACWLAQHLGRAVDQVVLYYAARAGDYSGSRASICAHFAEHDQYVSTSARRRMEQAIARSDCAYRAHDYPGTRHWFAESAHPHYDRAAAEQAMARTIRSLTSRR